jgi:hypothetical protein
VESLDELSEEMGNGCVDGIGAQSDGDAISFEDNSQRFERYSAKLIALLSRCYDFDSFQIIESNRKSSKAKEKEKKPTQQQSQQSHQGSQSRRAKTKK